jgi:hypothetical protein
MSNLSERLHKEYYSFFSHFQLHRRPSPAECVYMGVPIFVDFEASRGDPKLAWILNPEDFRELCRDFYSHISPLVTRKEER